MPSLAPPPRCPSNPRRLRWPLPEIFLRRSIYRLVRLPPLATHRARIHSHHSGRRTLAAIQRSLPLPQRLRRWHRTAARHAAGLARHFDSVQLGAVNVECGDSRFGCVTCNLDDLTCADAHTQTRISSSLLRISELGVLCCVLCCVCGWFSSTVSS